MQVNNWKAPIDDSIAKLKVEQTRRNDLHNEVNGALVEIIKYDVAEMQKIRYDFFKDITRAGVATPIYQSYCFEILNKFVHNRREIYKEAFLNYEFVNRTVSVDALHFSLDDYNYFIEDFLTQAAQVYAQTFMEKR